MPLVQFIVSSCSSEGALRRRWYITYYGAINKKEILLEFSSKNHAYLDV